MFLLHWIAKSMQQESRGWNGFRDIKCFNLALLAKTPWRLCHSTKQLWGSALKESYFPTTSASHVKEGKKSSWAWQSIQGKISFVQKFSFSILGSGKNILIWQDNWVTGMQSPPKPAGDFQRFSIAER
ncbi:uncharacterized protein LOC113273927 [Papaver somniferum]|uniref:uncharacterized protein LOC113273927 n=1 Tax=Papaver somniferum TaxID=3469 RepID=UPI000E6F8286|nr:uncharacterized protein LOC113273927 [Papaver somniferum]